MAKTTGVIRFNVKDRGRQHSGQHRNFDTVALARLINGAAVQERVRHRGMHGYFGHLARRVFGLEPGEGGIVDGKLVRLEPALLTVSVKADADGWIEHEAEFLDTGSGRLAWRQFQARSGGFSSVIGCDARKRINGVDYPMSFHGFDYVLEPNYSTNRGYAMALDSVEDPAERALLLDSVARDCDVLLGAFDSVQGELARALETVARMEEENNHLLDLLARRGAASPVLDSTAPGFERVARRSLGISNLETIAASFAGATLVGFEPLPEQRETKEAAARVDREADRILGRR